jgi:hypothetical protein
MVKFRKGPSKVLREDWHRFRQNARETAFHPELFADSDFIEFDLDTARITGEDNPRTYIWDRSIDLLDVNGYDVRDGDRR